MEDILTKIENGMESLILSMRTSGGYYFDWYTVNQNDVVKQTSPSAEIILTSEQCTDTDNSVWAGGYNQHAIYTIRVRYVMENKTENPTYAVDRYLNRCLYDLKKLFGNTPSVEGTCCVIMYTGMDRIRNNNNDVIRPKYMDTYWLVRYIQDRRDPSRISN